MLRITLDMNGRVIGQLMITNDNPDNLDVANYDFKIAEILDKDFNVIKTGRIEGFKRSDGV